MSAIRYGAQCIPAAVVEFASRCPRHARRALPRRVAQAIRGRQPMTDRPTADASRGRSMSGPDATPDASTVGAQGATAAVEVST